MAKPLSVFELGAANHGDAYIVRIGGELDSTAQPALELALEQAERSGADRIVLQLDALTFIDGRGLATIVQASRRSARNGNRLQVTRGRGQVARMFCLTELDRTLPFVAGSAEQAS